MKHLKILGLAVVSALALMAVLGVAAAAAAEDAKICSTSGVGESCGTGHGNVYTGPVTAVLRNGTTEPATLTSGFITVKCTTSHAEGNITNGVNGHGNLTSLTFSGCTSGLGSCTAKTTASSTNPWTVTVTKDGAPNALMDVLSKVTGEFTCAGITCKYITETAGSKGEITIDGGTATREDAIITAKEVPLTKEEGSSSLCSNEAKWTGNYTVTTPATLFFT